MNLIEKLQYSGIFRPRIADYSKSEANGKIYTVPGEMQFFTGFKPECGGLIDFLKAIKLPEYGLKHDSKPVYMLVGGDKNSDKMAGEFIESWLKKAGLEEKVRVDTFVLNRNGGKDPSATYNISCLKELHDIIEKGGYKVVFCDGDDTLWYSCMGSHKPYKSESRVDSVSRLRSLRLLFGMTVFEGDLVYSHFGINSRYLYRKSEDSLKWFLDSVAGMPLYFCIASFSCFKGIQNIIRRSKANVNVVKPYILK